MDKPRILDIGDEHETVVVCLDEPGAGGACHEYRVRSVGFGKDGRTPPDELARVSFQNGPIKEKFVNGCQNEDLLAIVIDRLSGFQNGDFPCRENSVALTHCIEALTWLNNRTKARKKRGVEGKSEE